MIPIDILNNPANGWSCKFNACLYTPLLAICYKFVQLMFAVPSSKTVCLLLVNKKQRGNKTSEVLSGLKANPRNFVKDIRRLI